MPDVVDPEKRSQMMSGIKNKHSKPELMIRKQLFIRGFRYRLHVDQLPGKPDLLLPQYKAAIFINGCFWHGHACHLFKWPKTRQDFWKEKILSNKVRDAKNYFTLQEMGWRVLVVHECALKGKEKIAMDMLMNTITTWLKTSKNDWLMIPPLEN